LDKLSRVYPAEVLPRRPLDENEKKVIKELHENKKGKDLVMFLLELAKRRDDKHPFPIEHPYASIFRQKPELIDKNPRTFKLLEEILLKMPIEDIIKGCERPIDINRVMGQAFQKWLKEYFQAKGIPFLAPDEFASHKDEAFLDGKDIKILEYANKVLGIELERGRDFLYKTKDKYVIGEARLLSTSGGSQTRDLRETISFIKRAKGKVIAIGVLDGIVWFNNSYVKLLSTLGEDEPAMSVLLLDDFLDSLR